MFAARVGGCSEKVWIRGLIALVRVGSWVKINQKIGFSVSVFSLLLSFDAPKEMKTLFLWSKKGKIILYRPNELAQAIEVKLEEETVWLSLKQIAVLFDRDKSVISRHLKNIFSSNELDKDSVVAKNATTALDGKSYDVEFYNLDAILSVGYRVNSKQGTQFRIWATRVLKDYLLKGYSINNRINRMEAKSVEVIINKINVEI